MYLQKVEDHLKIVSCRSYSLAINNTEKHFKRLTELNESNFDAEGGNRTDKTTRVGCQCYDKS